jgi:predicted DNA-binding transcriptional regulator YafY
MAKREKDMWASQMADLLIAVRLMTRPQGASLEELQEELGVSRRTVFRLKATLEQLINAPLDEVDNLLQKKKRYIFPKGFTLNLPMTSLSGLTTPELMALYAMRVGSGLFRNSDIGNDIDSAFEKIGKALSPATKDLLERYSSLFVSVPKNPKEYSAHAESMEELSLAILERKTCWIRYTSFSGEEIREKSFEINPLHFFERDGGLYVFVVVPYYNHIRLLAVERIKSVERTDRSFPWPDDFNPEELLKKAFGVYWDDPLTARIRFSPSQARYIRERSWAENQSIEEQDDGSIVLTLETSGRWDVKKWVLSFGAEAELLEPVEMRQEIGRELMRTLESYS